MQRLRRHLFRVTEVRLKSTRTLIKRHPVQSTLIALVCGAVVAFLLMTWGPSR